MWLLRGQLERPIPGAYLRKSLAGLASSFAEGVNTSRDARVAGPIPSMDAIVACLKGLFNIGSTAGWGAPHYPEKMCRMDGRSKEILPLAAAILRSVCF